MSLHARFLLLLGILGVAVLANIGVTVWSVGLLDREQRRPAEQIGRVLGVLNGVKRTLWEQAGEIGYFVLPEPGQPDSPEPPTERRFSEEEIDRFRSLASDASESLDDLADIENFLLRAGVNTVGNLRARMGRLNDAGMRYMTGGSSAPEERAASWTAARTEVYNLHEYIERLEARLIEEATLSVDHAERMQGRLLVTLGSSVLSVLLTLAAAGWLFRRWVILRIDRLRVAAEHIGRGDFEHRVAVAGSDELDRVGHQINEMTSTIVSMQAERIERERLAAVGEMVRRLAHNIRNPLGGIRSLAELSEQECAADDPVRDHQRRIVRTVDQFMRWLNDLMSVSNPLSVEPREEDVAGWLERLVESHRPMAESARASLALEVAGAPRTASFDRRHMEHALSALVTNAIEVSPPGSEVRVRAGVGPDDGWWSLSVSDEGPGIAPEHLPALFTPYFTTKKAGTGIGLAQARRVVQQHGGRIEAENRPGDVPGGSGAVFVIRLPLVPGGASATIGQSEEANSGQDSAPRRRRDAPLRDRAGA